MNVLFAVAGADGRVSNEEIEEIRTIANVQKIVPQAIYRRQVDHPHERRAD
jgi:uncharacterized tellurite resistance protein B-like protein